METKKKQLVNVHFSQEELEKIRQAQLKAEIFQRTEFIRQAVSEKCDKHLKGAK
jgi:hypothetical protein